MPLHIPVTYNDQPIIIAVNVDNINKPCQHDKGIIPTTIFSDGSDTAKLIPVDECAVCGAYQDPVSGEWV